MKGNLEILHVTDIEAARGALTAGFCPVECSFGETGSVVDMHVLDHHGKWSKEMGVALKAYTNLFGARAEDPRFVVTGTGDLDATFAIAALAGILPPKDKMDLTGLAELINQVDIDYSSVVLVNEQWGPVILAWDLLSHRMPKSMEGFYFGIMLWEALLNNDLAVPFIKKASEIDMNRQIEASKAVKAYEKDIILGVVSDVDGFDVWYGRLDPNAPADDHANWRHPVVVYFDKRTRDITVGCVNKTVAETLFGDGGLMNAFKILGEGWGGRESIGGSPRGEKLAPEIIPEVCEKILSALNPSI